MTTAVRHCVECRFQRVDRSLVSKPSETSSAASSAQQQSKASFKDPVESIIELTYLLNSPPSSDTDETFESLLASFVKNPDSVLQDIDIQRLRAIIYRDVVRQNRSKTGKNVVIVVVNLRNIFLSLLFVLLCCI